MRVVWSVVYFCSWVVLEVNCQSLAGLLKFLGEGIQHSNKEPRDYNTFLKEYDFIIVGAGSAGCVVANRLTENPDWKVLLIEAGMEENYLMDIPIVANLLQFSDANWKYTTISSNSYCLAMDKHRCKIPRGKVMGGSSVLNYMIFTRGNRRDYDYWAAIGNKGWSYNQVLPYFKKSEDIVIPDMMEDTVYHHRGGPLTVSNPPFRSPLGQAFVQAGLETGQRYVDYNGAVQSGFAYHQASMKNGTRWSTSRAFLHPINNRKNLFVTKNTQVTKVLIDPTTKQAYGVEFVKNGRKYFVRARKEVVLSAGAINSPQLLMLSGVGPRKHLQTFDIPVIQDLPVGENLQDHVALGGLTFLVNDSVSIKVDRVLENPRTVNNFINYHKGWPSIPGGTEAIGFYDLQDPGNPDGYPDLELLFIAGTLSAEPTLKKNFGISDTIYNSMYRSTEKMDGFMIFPMVLRPGSKGSVKLRSKNPFHSPVIDMGYFTDPADLDVLVAGVRKSQELAKTRAFKKYNARLLKSVIPGCRQFKFDSDDYWKCHARHFSFTIYHQSCTCKMGPIGDPTAVVDPRLRVQGIRGLRVIDASVMPKIPAAHTNSPTIMIGEKGADLIKQDWGFSTPK
ncbi:glucose dehydrogenase [FAD, quinone]-like [Macrosteles quadrilineatus]|uniref:glucose dehydrogenase [FAD, quinone]-like n=1 Tax=Macrosteles quadrilineatus TaxID=74068 RepID=UPI0023E32910|nr:glucose dehydrogenase [FAD, quinone]-like [Macrosteles quadrilineatus]